MNAGVVLPDGPRPVSYVTDHPVPEPGPGEVRVRLAAAALNANDLWVIGERASLEAPAVIGSDGAGTVDRLGEGVASVEVGERVVILPSLHWGDDPQRPSPDFEILGHPTAGTHAEHAVVPAGNVRPSPAGWSLTDAAALPLAGLTAWRALTTRGRLADGETLLVTGASGGVASFLVALGRDLGARVLVTTSSEESLVAAREAGAADGVLRTSPDWPARVRRLSNGGVDLAIDSAGDLQPVLDTLAVGGRLVSLGRTASRRTTIDVGSLFKGHHTILGTSMGSPQDFDDLLAHVADADWRPVIDSVWPLEQYAAALDRQASSHRGKIVLRIAAA